MLFSYRDADIYERDLALFHRGQWLNDSCISYCFRIIEDQISATTSASGSIAFRLCFLDPAVVSFILMQADEDDLVDLYSSLNLNQKDWIFIPITDQVDFSISSTHWSLLLCGIHPNNLSFMHFDSYGRKNFETASRASTRLQCILQSRFITQPSSVAILPSFSSIEVVECYTPQQENGYDCGVYTLLAAQYLASFIVATTLSDPSTTDMSRTQLQGTTAEFSAGDSYIPKIDSISTPVDTTNNFGDYALKFSNILRDRITPKVATEYRKRCISDIICRAAATAAPVMTVPTSNGK